MTTIPYEKGKCLPSSFRARARALKEEAGLAPGLGRSTEALAVFREGVFVREDALIHDLV